jgi:hypothetical protein
VLKGRIDALEANYPTVRRLVGDEWFRAAAAIYAGDRLPASPVLLEYGAEFPEFLARFGPAGELPYLPGVARLDRYWTEAHVAADEETLDPAFVARMKPHALASLCVRPHVSARWAWFEMPVATIWRRNRHDEAVDLSDVEWRDEGVLIVRPADAVQAVTLDRACCAFLDACAEGATLAAAAAHALEVDTAADLSAVMARLLQARALAFHTNREGATT